jgi:NAD(P)-dependent dehydrogenase (short-subunit alcohol dehydrogenase family)
MAYFVLTMGLRERLLASRPACVINTASASHQRATLDFDDLQSVRSFGAVKAYGRSKLCNILFTRELARRLRHPGFVATRIGDQSGGLISYLTRFAKVFRTIARERRGNDGLSRVLTRGWRVHRTILL